jgi:hypothetical protein
MKGIHSACYLFASSMTLLRKAAEAVMNVRTWAVLSIVVCSTLWMDLDPPTNDEHHLGHHRQHHIHHEGHFEGPSSLNLAGLVTGSVSR